MWRLLLLWHWLLICKLKTAKSIFRHPEPLGSTSLLALMSNTIALHWLIVWAGRRTSFITQKEEWVTTTIRSPSSSVLHSIILLKWANTMSNAEKAILCQPLKSRKLNKPREASKVSFSVKKSKQIRRDSTCLVIKWGVKLRLTPKLALIFSRTLAISACHTQTLTECATIYSQPIISKANPTSVQTSKNWKVRAHLAWTHVIGPTILKFSLELAPTALKFQWV